MFSFLPLINNSVTNWINFLLLSISAIISSQTIKVAWVVKLKLASMEWLFNNLVILIKLCKIQYLNLDKVLIFPRNQAICLKNWKLWRAATTTKFNICCWNFADVSYLAMSTGGCSGFFFILFRSWVINKNVKNECAETRSILIFANNSNF